MKKRVLCLLLALAMILSFSACASSGRSQDGTTQKPDTTSSPTGTENPIDYEEDELPDNLDFGGAVVTFLTPADSEDGWFEGEITVEELMNEVINDSIYNRELFVEDRLNVEIKNVADSENYAVKVGVMINSGDDTYQILSQRALRLSQMVPNGYFYNLYDFKYLDLDKPWWSQKFIEKAELMDNLFMVTGSLSLSLKRFLFAVFYNKKVAEDYSDKIPGLSDLYSIVEDGKWTFDKMLELGGNLYVDLNGDSNRDEEDFYGIGINKGIDIDTLWSSFDIKILSKDEDGWLKLDVNADKMYSALDMYSNLIHNTKGCFAAFHTDDALETLESKLASDTLLFSIDRIYAAETPTLRDMQHDYGILPCPKYDESQTDYYSYAHDQYTTFAIPITVVDLDCAGAVLEAMASYSYRNTEPAYLDMALKGKYMNDIQSRRMIDIVVNGFQVDSAWIYVETYASRFPTTFRALLEKGDTSYTSTYVTLKRTIEKTFPIYKSELIEMLENMENAQ